MIIYQRKKEFDVVGFTEKMKLLCLITPKLSGYPVVRDVRLQNFIAISDVVFKTIFAVGNFEHLSPATKVYASLLNLFGSGKVYLSFLIWFSHRFHME